MAGYDNAIPEGTDSDDPTPSEKPEITVPDDFDDEESFCKHVRETFADDVAADHDNTVAGKDDQRFLIGVDQQWNPAAKERRERAKKPVLMFNRLVAFLAQVTGHRRMNQTEIKIAPDNGGQKSAARTREGLVRNIQKQSRASIAYNKAHENQVACGIGNFGVEVDYDPVDVFNQSIQICQRPDPFSVVWDRMSVDPTGRDASHCFVIDTYSKSEFEREWPWANPGEADAGANLLSDVRASGWFSGSDVRVVSYWRMRSRKVTLAMMPNGDIRDVTDEMADAKTAAEIEAIVVKGRDGKPVMREVDKPYAEMTLCSGNSILEEPYKLEISRVPEFRVPGWEVMLDGVKYRWGLIRFAKDPQRLHNYWRSILAEKMTQSPKAVWTARKSAVAGREAEWRNSHLSDDSLLIWNDDAAEEPKRVEPAQIEVALLGQAEINTQDLKDITNIHEANLGMPSNEVSRVAIQARQRVSDTGTAIYHDNLALAIEEAGRVINELIDTVYDTPRVIKIIGEDGKKEDMVAINQIGDPESDILSGKYSVTVVSGPSTETKRIEARESMQGLANAAPQSVAMFMDLFIEAQDWPMADKIAKRVRATMPPQLLDPEDMTPEQQQAAAAASQAAAQERDLAIKSAVAEYMKTFGEAQLAGARAQLIATQNALEPMKQHTAAVTAAATAADKEAKNRLKAVEIAHSGDNTSGG